MKNPKGSVTIETRRGRLQLRLPRQLFNGEQKRLSLGLPDNEINRAVASLKAKEIEFDIAYDKFDFSLDKYKYSHSNPKNLEHKLVDIWDKYVDHKLPLVSVTTANKDFKKIRNHILNFPYQNISEARKIKNYIIGNNSLQNAKKIYTQINAACNWAVNEELIETNPFEKLKIKQRVKNSKEINPFTKEEREMILEAFKDNHYEEFVRFLFLTGCRTSEAVGLCWKHIDQNLTKIKFCEVIVERKFIKTTKTGKIRYFPVNEQLRSLLEEMDDDRSQEEPVFKSEKGSFVDAHNFLNRHWKPIVNKLPIEYRPQYNTRHTFISHCLEADIPVTQIAKWVGNSSKTIWEHYAGLISKSEVPEI
jgi:integrase